MSIGSGNTADFSFRWEAGQYLMCIHYEFDLRKATWWYVTFCIRVPDFSSAILRLEVLLQTSTVRRNGKNFNRTMEIIFCLEPRFSSIEGISRNSRFERISIARSDENVCWIWNLAVFAIESLSVPGSFSTKSEWPVRKQNLILHLCSK